MSDLRLATPAALNLQSALMPTVTRDLVTTKSVAEQYAQVVAASQTLPTVAKDAIEAVQNVSSREPSPHPNALVRNSGWYGFSAPAVVGVAATVAMEVLVPGFSLITGLIGTAGTSVVSGIVASVSGQKRRQANDEKVANAKREALTQAVPEKITAAVNEILADGNGAAAVVAAEAAEQLLAESHTTRTKYATAEMRAALQKLIAHGDAQSPDNIARAERFLRLEAALHAGDDSGYYDDYERGDEYVTEVLAAYEALEPAEKTGLADMIYSKLFDEHGWLSRYVSDEERDGAEKLVGILLAARIEHIKTPPPEPQAPASTERFIEQMFTMYELLAQATLTTGYNSRDYVTNPTALEQAIGLVNAPWLSPAERNGFKVAVDEFRDRVKDKSAPATGALLKELTIRLTKKDDEMQAAARALRGIVGVRDGDYHFSWSRDVAPELAILSPDLSIAVAKAADACLFGEGRATDFNGAVEAHKGIHRILRKNV